MTNTCICTHIEGGQVAIITLNRPQQLNALNEPLMNELGQALRTYDADPAIGCIVITGNEKAFAAGADIHAMAQLSFAQAYQQDFITHNWEALRSVRKALSRLGCIVPPGMAHVRPMGASVHYAGTVPMSAQPRPLSTSPDGESHDLRGLYFADGSTFPFLPAKNLTFTLMANAERIARRWSDAQA